jgi:hypothetical protein
MSHPRALSVLDIAQNAPDACGLSIAFEFTRASRDGEDFIRVTKLFSVDLVDSPAANPGGLFSAHTPIIQPMPADELEAVARATYGNAQVDSWKRNTLGLRELATRNFHLDGLNVVGLDTRAVAAKYGQPEISGLARVRRGELQARVNRFFAAKSAAK